uniref:Chaperonin GroEL, chloroplastic n=1 Tax=Flintiella sanguinaria TaxID=101926 RepID=A0A1X9PUC9_9RHOD|nr:60 kDa chaperone protein [Flintiella sanguinaria]
MYNIIYENNARKMLIEGMRILNDAVAVTIGPKGRNVVVSNQFEIPQIINDGITIAKEIQLKNKVYNTGVALIRQATSQTNEIAGDGTTTATILAYSIVKQGLINIESGSNPVMLRSGIEKSTKFVIDQIIQFAKPIQNLKSIFYIASISAGNNNELGKIVATAIEKVGRDGVINLEEGRSIKTELVISEGLTFNKGFISSYFLGNDYSSKIVQHNPYILLVDNKITSLEKEIVPILNKIKNTGSPLLIIAEDIDKEVISTLVINKMKNISNVVAVRAPGLGDQARFLLEDLAILTNANVITKSKGLGLDNIGINDLGIATKAFITKESTTIINDRNRENIKIRCDNLRKQIKVSDSIYEKQKLQERLAQLTSAVATIKVGAITETEMKDKKLRLEDSINATRAAILEGVVPGGGAALLHISIKLIDWAKNNLVGDELTGALILAKSLELPSKQIINNAGENGSLVIEKIKKMSFNMGYDSMNKRFSDMYEVGIIDPAKVTRSAIQNASSIANMILSTDCIVLN